MYDHTIDKIPGVIKNSVFYNFGIGATSSETLVTLEDCLKKYPPPPKKVEIILKIDVEGAE